MAARADTKDTIPFRQTLARGFAVASGFAVATDVAVPGRVRPVAVIHMAWRNPHIVPATAFTLDGYEGWGICPGRCAMRRNDRAPMPPPWWMRMRMAMQGRRARCK